MTSKEKVAYRATRQVGDFNMLDIPMLPWEQVEPDAEKSGKEIYAGMLRSDLALHCRRMGLGSPKGKTDQQLRNMLAKEYVAFSKREWSKDLSAGRKVRGA